LLIVKLETIIKVFELSIKTQVYAKSGILLSTKILVINDSNVRGSGKIFGARLPI